MSSHRPRHGQQKHRPRRAVAATADDDGGVLGRNAAPLVRRAAGPQPIDDPYAAYLEWRRTGHGRDERCECEVCQAAEEAAQPRRRFFTRHKDELG